LRTVRGVSRDTSDKARKDILPVHDTPTEVGPRAFRVFETR
jgi:hypothetical protein